MAKTFFSFALADSMFNGEARVHREPVTPEAAKAAVEEAQNADTLVSAVNKSHVPTLEAMTSRFGIDVPVPETAPHVALQAGDRLVVMSVRGLPRLEGRTQYTDEEIAKAGFVFAVWTRES